MAVFIYKGMTDKGLIVKNKVEEENKQKLMEKLKQNNITPIDIVRVGFASTNKSKKRKNISNAKDILKDINTAQFTTTQTTKAPNRTVERIAMYLDATKKVTVRDIIIFTQDLYLLKKSNFNNIHALTTIIQSTENMSLRGILEDILAGLEAGQYMYSTMEYYSDVFPFIYINMVKVGELSGSLTASLEQAVKYLEESTELTKKVKKILIPNIAQFIGIIVLLVAGTLVAIPQIENLFDELGSDAKLPPITIWFKNFLAKVMEYWPIPTLIVAVIVGIIVFYINTPRGKYNFHYFKYKMPIFGGLIFSLDFSRFIQAIELNVTNGMRIQEALEVSKNITKNQVMLALIETSINNILTGYSWIKPFEDSGLCSMMQTEMLKIGMQTDLTEMLGKLREYMNIDIKNTMEKITAVMPQVVYSIVGVVLIFFVCVILVPIIQFYMGNFLFSAAGV